MEDVKNKKENPDAQLPLEALFGRLDEVAGRMEAGDTSLEEAFRLYQEGMKLLKQCSEKIDTVEKKVLVLEENGETHEF